MKEILAVRGDQAQSILGLLRSVATNEGAFDLHPIHHETLEAMARHLFETEFDPEAPAVAFSDAGSIAADEKMAMQIMNMAGILPFAEEEHEQEGEYNK